MEHDLPLIPPIQAFIPCAPGRAAALFFPQSSQFRAVDELQTETQGIGAGPA